MTTILHIANESQENRHALFTNAAAEYGFNEAIIEKDFWVCWTLEMLFHHSVYAENLSFKGGTSLSKGFHLINRFSEDIDLILDWRLLGYKMNGPWDERSRTKQNQFVKSTNKQAEAYICDVMKPSLMDLFGKYLKEPFELDIDDADKQTIRFVYPQLFKDKALRQEIRLEIGPLAAWTPVVTKTVESYAASYKPDLFEKKHTEIRMVSAARTFWEKATILHQEANRSKTKMPARYSRHYYDLYMMAQTPVKHEAMNDLALLLKVVHFKQKFYACAWAQYEHATPKEIKLLPREEHMKQLKDDYAKMEGMLFGEIPAFETLLQGLKDLEDEIHALE
ncbi:MAG: nucleotidyl transferase AbiEii/AbiGii toxin family protein [Bacillota bacterium]|nr:nucleotidyl transferase AbiEii/AbiGii toxin family protein [Bacillota bacterium]MDW7676649.1 nucleotidyl transferase AbiEii/AbiGii toxin family protein [Bacillota bacterium]